MKYEYYSTTYTLAEIDQNIFALGQQGYRIIAINKVNNIRDDEEAFHVVAVLAAIDKGAVMTREEAIKILEREQGNPDVEQAHSIADNVLIDLLDSLGYDDVIDVYEKVGKWYA